MKNILVTGGAGFIGANFIHYVLENEPLVNIINFDKLSYAGSLENLRALPHPERYYFVHGDICHRNVVERTLKEFQIDTIVHFAAESHVDRSITTPIDFVQTNLMGTFVLLDAARQHGHCRFHHISTDEVYGSLGPNDLSCTEETTYKPRSPYSASKAGSDHLVNAYYHTFGLPVTLSNCSNNYGPLQHAEKFIPTVIRACMNHTKIPIYGDGSNIRDWLYVTDHCRAILNILKQGKIGESYNIGGNNERTNLEVARMICELMDELNPAKTSYINLLHSVKDRLGHDFRYSINDKKIRNELGWEPKESFESGLRKTILSITQPIRSQSFLKTTQPCSDPYF